MTTSSEADPDPAAARTEQVVESHRDGQFDDVLRATLEELDTAAGRGGAAHDIPTGFAELDAVTNGLPRGSLTVIGAHPGVGSSTLALDFLRRAAFRHDVPAAYLSLDDTAEAITRRLISAEARIRLADARSGQLTEADRSRVAKRMTAIQDKSVVITRLADPDITALTDTVTTLAADQDVRLVVVDSLHMVTARRDTPYENREREVAEVTRRLKRLALDTGTAIVTTAQLSVNPGPRQPVPPPPSLADLRDSGTIAHVADHVLLIHRPDAWDRDDPRAGEADLILAKHRHGPTATVLLAQQLHYGRFVPIVTG
ncbi:DnaB-like helicase C-terminal domain-containing protein [Umezawaea beigongshangensis]|uniref:DnaB-like helicase C-terminal domain-containing protein n=1 Tax=Umezawaea beigongshangensis TaxID=2780383 RepID=UPI0018F22903|nr:DnaB-like helicase C-terminal domain-containing protein [Umezawaea beigongshangensis]